MKPSAFLLAGIFLLSAAVLTLELLESRIFAFVLWHHLGFMVISIAMLGLAVAWADQPPKSPRAR